MRMLITNTLFILIIAALLSCQASIVKAEAVKVITVDEFIKNADRFLNNTVSVRGFLVPDYPSLSIKTGDAYAIGSQEVFVIDPSLGDRTAVRDGKNGEALFFDDLGCTRKYAIVTGVVGKTIFESFGITRIIEIKTFAGNDFAAPGEICFVRD